MEIKYDRFVREDECKNITGLSKTTRWRMEQKGTFPSRVRIGNRIVAWKLSKLNQWLESQGDPHAAD